MPDFEQNFLARATQRSGLALFRAPDACALVDAARARSVPILGVETFLLTAEATHPQMDHILDLSGANEQCDTWTEAQRFITDRGAEDYFFEVTV